MCLLEVILEVAAVELEEFGTINFHGGTSSEVQLLIDTSKITPLNQWGVPKIDLNSLGRDELVYLVDVLEYQRYWGQRT
jgi:hypothetical protein